MWIDRLEEEQPIDVWTCNSKTSEKNCRFGCQEKQSEEGWFMSIYAFNSKCKIQRIFLKSFSLLFWKLECISNENTSCEFHPVRLRVQVHVGVLLNIIFSNLLSLFLDADFEHTCLSETRRNFCFDVSYNLLSDLTAAFCSKSLGLNILAFDCLFKGLMTL